ncbi:homing endonuclease associated repeat-containing protein [Haloarchaeobius salinus]|uniref:homing endonuclease associated repeat-containing protein n=1 Tax=Haloarchaeobius salinus TaxID=1198298 RepID=UPI00210ABD27|nr:HNH endonuclease [Haloarchaeobius salinus]
MTTESACIEALQTAAQRLDESPTKAAYEDLGLRPASATIIRTMGGWNDAKEAAGLETNPSSGTRVGPKPDDLPADVDDAWASLSVDQRWHYRNSVHNRNRTLTRRARLRSWVNELKADAGCRRCGETETACLDYHHRDGVDKEMNVSQMVTNGYGMDELQAEIAKCDVLCANCHRKEHFVDPLEAVPEGYDATADD